MPAPQGNQFWKQRAKSGRDKIFATDDALWEAACEYFEWVEENPLKEQKVFHTNGVITKDDATLMRAMTIDGFCLFVGVCRRTWLEYKGREDFLPIIERIEQVIYEHKFTGAAAGLLNANIIARDLGLRDSKELTGPDGDPLITKLVFQVVDPDSTDS
ncbi:DNA-packaging protein [Candidatus Pacearchaeota archaeon]|nr:DNA-packaging protein [Candidatus Pacearchaeota archaeon]